MKTWTNSIGLFLFLFGWLFLISLPLFAFVLTAVQQIQIGGDEGSQLRVFLLQEKGAEGIGVELARPFSADPRCMQSTVRYFMWAGAAENVTFCQCFEPQTGDNLPATPNGCIPP